MRQFFVRGLSRTGGTLMATILDAHPQIAMSYEIYEHLLDVGTDETLVCEELTAYVDHMGNSKKNLFINKHSEKVSKNIIKFIARIKRSGISKEALREVINLHFGQGGVLSTIEDRMLLIEAICKLKGKDVGKEYWGAKVASGYSDLSVIYPKSCVFFMLRDGRDMCASRKKNGSFNQTAEKVAKGWCKQIELFEKFMEKAPDRAFMVKYEELTSNPEQVLKKLMDDIKMPWDDQLLDFYKKDLTIHKNSTGHLSAEQINKPINTSSVERWRKDLTEEEISTFEEIAGDTLRKYGYIV